MHGLDPILRLDALGKKNRLFLVAVFFTFINIFINPEAYEERAGGKMDEECTTKAAKSIFTAQFLNFLSAVQIAVNNDVYLKAKVTLVFCDLQHFFKDNGLTPGQMVSILSTCITNMMLEKKTGSNLDVVDSFI